MQKKFFLRNFFETCILDSWWVILLFLVGTFVYDRAGRRLLIEEARLQDRLFSLRQRIAQEEELHQDLVLRIENRLNPETLELILMERLGLVPQGYIKINLQQPSTLSR